MLHILTYHLIHISARLGYEREVENRLINSVYHG